MNQLTTHVETPLTKVSNSRSHRHKMLGSTVISRIYSELRMWQQEHMKRGERSYNSFEEEAEFQEKKGSLSEGNPRVLFIRIEKMKRLILEQREKLKVKSSYIDEISELIDALR